MSFSQTPPISLISGPYWSKVDYNWNFSKFAIKKKSIWSSFSRAGVEGIELISLLNFYSINVTILCVSESLGISIKGSKAANIPDLCYSLSESYSGISRICIVSSLSSTSFSFSSIMP